jgi:DNA-binding beta-propeller fold protein YncE
MPTFKTLLAGAFLLAQLASTAAAQSLPPAPPQKIAVNALTSKVYTANYDADTVTVFNPATGTSVPIAVGDGPLYVAVNPVTNRVYVNNARAASLSVIDGATDTLIATYPLGSTGPIAVNPVTNVIYVVRLTGTGTDEVTYFNGANNTWYTIAVQSHQPIAVATNPVTDKIFVAAYATGNLSMIDGAYNPSNDHPTPVKAGMWSKPFGLAVNPVTNKVFVITEDSRGPIAVFDANTLGTTFLLAGTARVPKAVAVNPVTNKAYALFSNELVVIDGGTLATTSLPVADAGTGVAALGVNTATNRILVATATGVLTVIDGATNSVVATDSVPAGTSGVAIDAASGMSYYFDSVLHAVPRAAGETPMANPVSTTITPLAGDVTGPDFTLTFDAANMFPSNPLPIRGVYYRLDAGPWTAATEAGPYKAVFSGVAPGAHTVYAFAVEGQDAPLATGAHASPLIGTMAAYSFIVTAPKADPSVSLASSSGTSVEGTAVTFTASVSGSQGTPTGAVTFRFGATAFCDGVTLESGAATCTSTVLPVGTHDITAEYSGDASYNPRVSDVLQHQVTAAPTVPGAPLGVTATPGDGQATIAFSPPSSNGGSPITGYTVSCTPGPAGASASASPIVVTGLANGTTYSCDVRATNDVGSGPASASVNVTPQAPVEDPPRLGNISTRGHVLAGDDVMIGGFVIGGSANKTVAIVATGPSLSSFGIDNALANPTITLVRSSDQAVIATNDDWGTDAQSAQLQAAGFAPGNALESGLHRSLPPGAYTVIVQGAGGGTGISVIGVYEVDGPAIPLANISTRARVQTGNNVMIGGFVVQGTGPPRTVAIVATGPSLSSSGIASPLANPTITLVRSSDQAVIATNDDWGTDAQSAQLQAAGFAPGNALESGLYRTLQPGAYTVIVEGVGGGTGVAVMGVYAVQ